MAESKLNKSLDDIIKENAKGASKGAPRRAKAPSGRPQAQAKQSLGPKGGVGKKRAAPAVSVQTSKPGNRQRGRQAAPASGRRPTVQARQTGPRTGPIRVTIANDLARPVQRRVAGLGLVTAAAPVQQRQALRPAYQAAYVPQMVSAQAQAQAQAQAYHAQQARAQLAFLRDDAERGDVLTTNANGMRMDQYGSYSGQQYGYSSAARPRLAAVQ